MLYQLDNYRLDLLEFIFIDVNQTRKNIVLDYF